MKGGPGRRVLRTVCLVSGAPHVITVSELGRAGPLRVVAYDPATSLSHESRLSKAERACFGFDHENCKSWREDLCRRLSLRRAGTDFCDGQRQGDHQSTRRMIIDKTIFSTAVSLVSGTKRTRVLRMRATLIDAGRSLAVDLCESDSSMQCRVFLTSDDLASLSLPSPTSGAQETNHPPHVERSPTAHSTDNGKTDANTMSVVPEKLADTDRMGTVMRHLVERLRFAPDSDEISLSVNNLSRTMPMLTSENVKKRRPQTSLKAAYSRNTNGGQFHGTGNLDSPAIAFRRHHQAPTLRQKDKSALTRHDQPIPEELRENRHLQSGIRWDNGQELTAGVCCLQVIGTSSSISCA